MNFTQPLGNNSFSYDKRKALGSDCDLVIADPCEISSLDQVKLGNFTVFEEIDHHGELQSCTGLACTYVISPRKNNQETSKIKSPTIIITDNHNHVLPYRLEVISQHTSQIKTSDIKNCVNTKSKTHLSSQSSEICLIHIDQHSDLGPNSNILNLTQIQDPHYRRDYAHLECNIGNFITPCISIGLISEMTQIRTEYKLNEYVDLLISSELIIGNPLILDIDIDFRAPEMSIGDRDKTMNQVRSLMNHADLITIATSPYFIDQKLALNLIRQLLGPRLAK